MGSRLKKVLVIFLILMVAMGGLGYLTYVKVMEAARYAAEGREHLTNAVNYLTALDFDKASSFFKLAENSFLSARLSLESLGVLFSIIGFAPVIGPQLTAGGRLVNVGYYVSIAGQNLSLGLKTMFEAGRDSFNYLSDRVANQKLKAQAFSKFSSSWVFFQAVEVWVDKALAEEGRIDPAALPEDLKPAVLGMRRQLLILKRMGGQLQNVTKAMAPLINGFESMLDAQGRLLLLDFKEAQAFFYRASDNFTTASLILEATPRPVEETVPELNLILKGILSLSRIGSYACRSGGLTSSSLELMAEALIAAGREDFNTAYEKLNTSRKGLREAASWSKKALVERAAVDLRAFAAFGDIGPQLEMVSVLNITVTQLHGLSEASLMIVKGTQNLMEAKVHLEALRLPQAISSFTEAEKMFKEASLLIKSIEKPPKTLKPVADLLSSIHTLNEVAEKICVGGRYSSESLNFFSKALEAAGLRSYIKAKGELAKAADSLQKALNSLRLAHFSLKALEVEKMGGIGASLNKTLTKHLSMANLTLTQTMVFSAALHKAVEGLESLVKGYLNLTTLSYAQALENLESSKASFGGALKMLEAMPIPDGGLQATSYIRRLLKDLAAIGLQLSSAGYIGSLGIRHLNLALNSTMQRPLNWVEKGDVAWLTSAKNNVTIAKALLLEALQPLNLANLTLQSRLSYGPLEAFATPLIKDLEDKILNAKTSFKKLQNLSVGMGGAVEGVYYMSLGFYSYFKGFEDPSYLSQALQNFTLAKKVVMEARTYIDKAGLSPYLSQALSFMEEAGALGEEAVKAAAAGDLALAYEKITEAMKKFLMFR